MSKQPPPAPIASTVSPCPTLIQISRTAPDIGRLPSTIRPPPDIFICASPINEGNAEREEFTHSFLYPISEGVPFPENGG